MQIRCSHCSAVGNVPEAALNRNIHCPRCGGVFTLTAELAAQGAERRRTERLDVQQVDLDFGIVGGVAQVRDLSASGVGFDPADGDVDFPLGQTVTFSMMDKLNPVLRNVRAKVTRTGSGGIGVEFEDLSPAQLAELKHFLARQRLERMQQEGEAVELEMDEETLALKSKGYL